MLELQSKNFDVDFSPFHWFSLSLPIFPSVNFHLFDFGIYQAQMATE